MGGPPEIIGISPLYVDSEDSSAAPKKKCISLNVEGFNNLDVPTEVICLSKMSASERRLLIRRLRSELEQIRALQQQALAVCSVQCRKVPSGSIRSAQVMKRSNSISDATLMKQCEGLLKKLLKHKHHWAFNKPVDVELLNIPDYYDIITQPMDLGTIRKKLASHTYPSPASFASDVRLTFSNAMAYNPPGNLYHEMAVVMSKFFEERWKPIEKKLPPADVPRLEPQSKRRKTPPFDQNIVVMECAKPKLTPEEKQELSKRLASLSEAECLPQNVIDLLTTGSGNANHSDYELEIDFDTIDDAVLLEVKNLLDSSSLPINNIQLKKTEVHDAEVLTVSGISNLSTHPSRVMEAVEEDIDICGNAPPISSHPPILIEKDPHTRNMGGSFSNSSGDSGSSASDSVSASSPGSEHPKDDVGTVNALMGNEKLELTLDQDKSDVVTSFNIKYPQDRDALSEPMSAFPDTNTLDENSKPERQVSPEKLYRAALLRRRYADTIVKAHEKMLNEVEKGDPEELQRKREEVERQQREEKARLLAEAKAVEDARRRAAEEAEAEAKRKRELEREAARQALLQMEKTVEINNDHIIKELEMLGAAPVEHIVSSVGETSPEELSHDALAVHKPGRTTNPLEQLGLFMKEDEEDEDDPTSVPPSKDDAEDEDDTE